MLKPEQIVNILKNPASVAQLQKARDIQAKHKLIIKGDGFLKELQNRRVKKIESDTLYDAKVKLARPKTPSIFSKFINQFDKTYNADGFNEHFLFDEKDSALQADAIDYLSKVWAGKSLKDYIRHEWNAHIIEDFNGIELVEIKEELDEFKLPTPYVEFYGLEYIFDLKEEDGEIVYLVLKWCETYGKEKIEYYRFIDSTTDAIFIKKKTDFNIFIKDGIPSIFENTLGYVPAVRVSDYKHSLSHRIVRCNHLSPGIEIAEQYQDIADDHVVGMKKHGYPLFFSKPLTCPKCNGRGETPVYNTDRTFIDSYISCGGCNGQKVVRFEKGDPTQGITLPLSDEPGNVSSKAESPAGFVENDIESLKEQAIEKQRRKDEVEESVLGVIGIVSRGTANKTATEIIVNYQPLEDRMNAFTDNIETVHTFLAKSILKLRYSDKFVSAIINYGRKYLLQTEAEAQLDYDNARKAGMPDSYLKEKLINLIKIRFENNKESQARALFLLDLEPFPTYTISELVNNKLALDKHMKIKQYFNDLVEQFERLNGPIASYKINMKYGERLNIITKIFEQMLQADGVLQQPTLLPIQPAV